MAKYLYETHGEDTEAPVRGKRLIELGAGVGVPGMAAHILGAKVLLTEQAHVIDLIRWNATTHFADEGLESAELDWYETGSGPLASTFDFILACDCIYEPLYGESWKALLQQMIALSNEDTRVLVSAEERTNDGVDKFLSAAAPTFECSTVCTTGKVSVYELRRRR